MEIVENKSINNQESATEKEYLEILDSIIAPALDKALHEANEQQARICQEFFSKYAGVDKTSPASFMFYGFALGFEMGLDQGVELGKGPKYEEPAGLTEGKNNPIIS